MVHPERLEIGEKCFVTGVMAVLGLEALLTIVTCGLHFSWIGLILGVAGFCLVLYLANQLYAGNRQAQTIALGWIGFQILYAVFALYLMVSSPRGEELAASIGAPVAWTVIVRALGYLSLGWILMRMPTVRDFFAEKRGEHRLHEALVSEPAFPGPITAESAHKVAVPSEAAPVPAATTPGVLDVPATPLELNAQQVEGARNLAQYLRWGVSALITLGVLHMLLGVFVHGIRTPSGGWGWQGLLVLIQGSLMVALGLALGGPSNEVRPLTEKEDQTAEQLDAALDSLAKFAKVQLAVGLLLVVVFVARFALVLL